MIGSHIGIDLDVPTTPVAPNARRGATALGITAQGELNENLEQPRTTFCPIKCSGTTGNAGNRDK
jgi:hypothetical protein